MTWKNRDRKNKIRLVIFAAAVFIGATSFFIWNFNRTHTSLLELVNIFQPDKNNAPPVEPLTPASSDKEINYLNLVPKAIVVPESLAGKFKPKDKKLSIPVNASVSVFAAGFKKLRFMVISPGGWPKGEAGVLFVTESDTGRVLAMKDENNDGVADKIVVVASGLNFPHGIVFHDNALWIAETTRVTKIFDDNNDLIADRKTVVVDNLPNGGHHISRTIVFDEAGRFYVSVGSSCNVCIDDQRRAAILRFNADGSGEEIFAKGSRNAVGIVFNPNTGELGGNENGRDLLGDDVPADEINILKRGGDYGWPICYGDKIHDTDFDKNRYVVDPCLGTVSPQITMQAHVAPLGLRFVWNDSLPNALQGDLLFAQHGSWNRTVPVGYQVVRVINPAGNPGLSPFVNGWLEGTKAWGRPVDILDSQNGEIFITDDYAGAIYRIVFDK